MPLLEGALVLPMGVASPSMLLGCACSLLLPSSPIVPRPQRQLLCVYFKEN
jgi:hypothetical protein